MRYRAFHLARLSGPFFLKELALKPHRIRYWLTPKPDPDFEAKCAEVCSAYLEALAAAVEGVHTVSIDEMTGVQALERAAPSLPMKPGIVERREFEYVRHGTQTLIAAFDVATGKVQGAVGATRTEADLWHFLKRCSLRMGTQRGGRSSATTSTPCVRGGGPPRGAAERRQ